MTTARDETATEADSHGEILTPEQAAALLGGDVTTETLRTLRQRGGGPPYFYVGAGRKPRYRLSSVLAWAEGREIAS